MLNRAEWIKFLGLFFNQDALAGTIFATINESYYDIASDIRVSLSLPYKALCSLTQDSTGISVCTSFQACSARIAAGKSMALRGCHLIHDPYVLSSCGLSNHTMMFSQQASS